jgi:hypothetical protein
MARPKLPIDQRRRLTMTVRIRQDLDEGFAAVAHIRGPLRAALSVNTPQNKSESNRSVTIRASLVPSKRSSPRGRRSGRPLNSNGADHPRHGSSPSGSDRELQGELQAPAVSRFGRRLTVPAIKT